uniref:Uncharacterized protein n=1 Tax=Burkholderia gladioli TaxID=28095 RepID=A0A4D8TUY2_BURGA|nr:unnamed protein product [Burkholderia gladioli]
MESLNIHRLIDESKIHFTSLSAESLISGSQKPFYLFSRTGFIPR